MVNDARTKCMNKCENEDEVIVDGVRCEKCNEYMLNCYTCQSTSICLTCHNGYNIYYIFCVLIYR